MIVVRPEIDKKRRAIYLLEAGIRSGYSRWVNEILSWGLPIATELALITLCYNRLGRVASQRLFTGTWLVWSWRAYFGPSSGINTESRSWTTDIWVHYCLRADSNSGLLNRFDQLTTNDSV